MTDVVLLPQWLQPEVQGLQYIYWDHGQPLPDVSEVTVFIPPYMPSAGDLTICAHMPKLQVVQALMAGVDGMLAHLPDVEVRPAIGVHDTSTAELAIGLMLASLRGIDRAARAMVTGHWLHERMPALADRRVGIVGWGGVGQAIARRLEAFEVEVLGFSRSGLGCLPASEFNALLPQLDVVVLALPLTPRPFMDSERLQRMHAGALLVNVGRGGLVDAEALLAELPRISAALDVTDPEPLPADHPLWQAPGVLITAHLGGDSEAFVPRARAMVAQFLASLVDTPKTI